MSDYIEIWDKHKPIRTFSDFEANQREHGNYNIEEIASAYDCDVEELNLPGPEANLANYFSGGITVRRLYNAHGEYYVYFDIRDEMVGFRNYAYMSDGQRYHPVDTATWIFGFKELGKLFNSWF